MRIWDLRRGDLEDNRTSPHGGNLRSLVVSAALEFNYLKALIGFLTLIIGPALLVGFIPSLIVTYGRVKFGVATGRSPIVAFVIVALLAGLALWIGRPVAAMAVESFRRLHYTLVVPIFVAVREILRVAVEKFPGRAAALAESDRGRRLGTILGGLLLAGGGITLAMIVGLSFGVQLVNIERVHPWAVARAAFGNAAVLLGLSTATESLYWVWREFMIGGRSKTGRQALPRVKRQPLAWRICRTCMWSASVTAFVWRPELAAHAATDVFEARCVSSGA